MKMQTIAKESAETLLYDQCLKRIFKWNLFRHIPHEQKENLDKMRALAGYFGNPQKMFKTIHVAGTNGKGSVSLKCAKSLESAGYKTGLFTSPHICTFRERITINSQKITEAKVIKFSQMIFEAVDKHQFDLTFFEVVTMIAFLQFAEERVDYAVLECGLGGRLDATNIIEKPECCAITSIGLDHREVLGDTVELIAQEKSGILKEGVPIVVGPTVTQDIVKERAKKYNSKLIQVEAPNFREANKEVVNNILDQLGIQIPKEAREIGLNTEQPCRLEKVPDPQIREVLGGQVEYPPIVYLDIAHNPQAVQVVMNELLSRHQGQKLSVVTGFSKMKDVTCMLTYLANIKQISSIYAVTSPHFKLASIDTIQDKINEVIQQLPRERQEVFQPIIMKGNVVETIRAALIRVAKENEVLLVGGTFFIMQDARECLGFQDEQDPKVLNQNN